MGLAVGAPADAALVSRGFLDEALENYATTTALDLKANQSDFTDLSDKIGTLPSGNFPEFPGNYLVFPELNQPLTYPTSLAELITAIYGNSETDGPGLLGYIIAGFPFDTDGDGQFDFYVGTLPNFMLATEAKELATTANTTATAAKTAADANTAKIGVFPPDTTPTRNKFLKLNSPEIRYFFT